MALAERLRAEGEDPGRGLGRRAAALRGARDAHRRRRRPPSARGSSTGCVGILPVTARATAGDYARRAHAEIDALVAAGRRPIVVGGTGLYLRAALAELDLRPPPDPASRASATRGGSAARARARCTPSSLARDPGAAAAIAPHRRPARRPRARAARRGRATRPAGDQLWTARDAPPDAARRARDGARGALPRHRRARRRDGRRRRRRRGAPRRRRRRLAVGAPGARLRGAAARRRRRHAQPHPPLRQAPAHLAAQAARRARDRRHRPRRPTRSPPTSRARAERRASIASA